MEDMDRAEGGTGEGEEPPNAAGDDAASNATDDDNPLYKTITTTPTEGIIEPFSQLPVEFTFNPKLSAKHRGFAAGASGPESNPSRNFAVKVTVEGAEVAKPLTLLCTGKAVLANIDLSSKILRFGTCPVFERRDILLTLKNTSELPMPFEFDKLPNFQAHPTKGVLKPQQTQSTVVSFAPGQMGERKAVMNLKVAGGMAQYPIRCMGQATAAQKGAKKELKGGPNMAADDFKPTFNFVKSEDAQQKKARAATNKFIRPQPWEEVDLLGSSAWDESKMEGANASLVAQAQAENKDTFSVQKLAEMADHKKKYVLRSPLARPFVHSPPPLVHKCAWPSLTLASLAGTLPSLPRPASKGRRKQPRRRRGSSRRSSTPCPRRTPTRSTLASTATLTSPSHPSQP